jgi:hypothetical protein
MMNILPKNKAKKRVTCGRSQAAGSRPSASGNAQPAGRKERKVFERERVRPGIGKEGTRSRSPNNRNQEAMNYEAKNCEAINYEAMN